MAYPCTCRPLALHASSSAEHRPPAKESNIENESIAVSRSPQVAAANLIDRVSSQGRHRSAWFPGKSGPLPSHRFLIDSELHSRSTVVDGCGSGPESLG